MGEKKEVSSVRIHEITPDAEVIKDRSTGIGRGFGYVTVEGSEAREGAERAIKAYNGTKWKGSKIRVGVAKGDYLERLKKEWAEAEEADAKARAAAAPPEHSSYKPRLLRLRNRIAGQPHLIVDPIPLDEEDAEGQPKAPRGKAGLNHESSPRHRRKRGVLGATRRVSFPGKAFPVKSTHELERKHLQENVVDMKNERLRKIDQLLSGHAEEGIDLMTRDTSRGNTRQDIDLGAVEGSVPSEGEDQLEEHSGQGGIEFLWGDDNGIDGDGVDNHGFKDGEREEGEEDRREATNKEVQGGKGSLTVDCREEDNRKRLRAMALKAKEKSSSAAKRQKGLVGKIEIDGEVDRSCHTQGDGLNGEWGKGGLGVAKRVIFSDDEEGDGNNDDLADSAVRKKSDNRGGGDVVDVEARNVAEGAAVAGQGKGDKVMKKSIFGYSSDEEGGGLGWEDDNSEDDEGRFRVRPQFEGEKGQELMKMQRRFGGDQRFNLDERFAENGGLSDGSDDQSGRGGHGNVGGTGQEHDYKENTANQAGLEVAEEVGDMAITEDTLKEEVERSLNMLGQMFGGKTAVSVPSADTSRGNAKKTAASAIKSSTAMRYDPSKDGSSELEVKKKHPRHAREKDWGGNDNSLALSDAEDDRRSLKKRQGKAGARAGGEVLKGPLDAPKERFVAHISTLTDIFKVEDKVSTKKSRQEKEVDKGFKVTSLFSDLLGEAPEGKGATGPALSSSYASSSLDGGKPTGGNGGQAKNKACLNDDAGEGSNSSNTHMQPCAGGKGLGGKGAGPGSAGKLAEIEDAGTGVRVGGPAAVGLWRPVGEIEAMAELFVRAGHQEDVESAWIKERKGLTQDFKRKYKDAIKHRQGARGRGPRGRGWRRGERGAVG